MCGSAVNQGGTVGTIWNLIYSREWLLFLSQEMEFAFNFHFTLLDV